LIGFQSIDEDLKNCTIYIFALRTRLLCARRKYRSRDLWWGRFEVGQIELPTIRGGRASVLKTMYGAAYGRVLLGTLLLADSESYC
jgi:hypothetical protein